MRSIISLAQDEHRPIWAILVLIAASAVACFSARTDVGGWNDGSRLATVECLVDYHTMAIDQSLFRDTGDKLFIQGHFYSDKSPVPALLMAGLYQGWQWCTGLRASKDCTAFCYVMTLASSGLAYVVAVWCILQLGGMLRLPMTLCLGLTASFALATLALPYVRHVNNHILLLGVASLLMLELAKLAEEGSEGRLAWHRLPLLGALAGLGYTIDLGAGPVLVVCTVAVVVYRCRRLGPLTGFVLAALPWLALHHAVNYAVGGTFKPANAVPEYFDWPGCSFNAQNLTGGFQHANVGHFLTYAVALLAGKRGFLGHDLALFLAVPGLVILLRRRGAELPELLFAACWGGGTWLAYALNSNNYSGQCCSIRWFVPLLAPGYYVLGVFLRQHPRYRTDFLILTAWGSVLAGVMWHYGPWIKHMVPGFWPVQGLALVTWLLYRNRRRRQAERVANVTKSTPQPLAA